MEELLVEFLGGTSGWILFGVIAVAFFALAKGADLLVDEAVALSVKWHVPKAVIGATVVSLGTTMPEAVVSVLAALKGNAELALGNAVGSIICDTGLVLGVAILISPMPINRKIVNRQGWLQLSAGILLVVTCLPFGRLPQLMGILFLILLVVYIYFSVRWSREGQGLPEPIDDHDANKNSLLVFSKLVFGIAIVVLSSWIAIPAVKEAAIRLHVPPGIIAATLVAFGTSLPELVTAVTSALKGHGEVGLGNVIGADILNVLFVAGAAAAVTQGGLIAPAHFFQLLFPAMLFVLIVFRIGLAASKDTMKKSFGVILLAAYVLVTVISYRAYS